MIKAKSSLLACILAALFSLSSPHTANADSENDNEIVIQLPAKSSSKVYHRPKNAEYFWWDTDAAVQAELTFEGGSKKQAGSEETFSEKIISVKFINPLDKPFEVKLWSRP